MSKNLTEEELEELFEQLGKSDFNLDDFASPQKSRKSLKPPLEKVMRYTCLIEDCVFWASRQAYLDLLQNFLLKKVDAGTLTSKFFELRVKDIISREKLCVIIEDQIRPIPDLYYTFKAEHFSSLIDELSFEIDRYDSNTKTWNDMVYSESKLRSVIQEKFVSKLQDCCDLNDSFFRSQVDLDQVIRKSYLIFIMISLGLVTSLII